MTGNVPPTERVSLIFTVGTRWTGYSIVHGDISAQDTGPHD